MANYDDLLNRSWDEIPEEAVLPVGDWALEGKSASFIESKEDGKSDKIVFFWGVTSPVDVDEEEIAKLGSDYDLDLNQPTQTFYIDGPSAIGKVRKFLLKLGVDIEGLTPLESLKAFKGARAVAFLDQRSYQDQSGETVWQNDVKKVRALEE